MTIIGDAPVIASGGAALPDLMPVEPPVVSLPDRVKPTAIETPDCACASFFGRLMMWATRNVER